MSTFIPTMSDYSITSEKEKQKRSSKSRGEDVTSKKLKLEDDANDH